MLSYLCASLLTVPALAQEEGDVKTDPKRYSETTASETEESDTESSQLHILEPPLPEESARQQLLKPVPAATESASESIRN